MITIRVIGRVGNEGEVALAILRALRKAA